ncbi:MAG: TIGR03936 family radical SAM-associated protein [Christensenellales bacterium]|jgi:radical SAM-linked protein
MISAKFTKLDNAVYISHIDMLKMITCTLRRANLKVAYSGGYNPHPLIKFSPPIPLGLPSRAEYFTLQEERETDIEEFIARFNRAAIDGAKILLAQKTATDPNFAGLIVQSDYLVCADIVLPSGIEELGKSDCVIEYTYKGVRAQEEVSSKIFGIKAEENKLYLRLAAGGENLRLDRLLAKINADFHLNLGLGNAVRTAQYVLSKEGVKDADIYLGELANEKNIC